MKKSLKKLMCGVLALGLVCSTVVVSTEAAGKAKLDTKTIKLKVGKKKTIRIKAKKKKAKYTFKSSKKSVVTVSAKGVVKAVKKGSASITVKETLKGKKRTLGKVKVTVSGKTDETFDVPTVTEQPGTPAVSNQPTVTSAPTTEPTVAPTNTPAPTPEPTLGPNGDQYITELFRVKLKDTEVETVNGNTCKVDMQFFNGTAEGTYFNGKVLSESCDIKKSFKDGKISHCYRYVLSGKDADGKTTKIFVEDNGTEADGKVISKPIFITNNKNFAWIETSDIQGRMVVGASGEKVISFVYNPFNKDKFVPREVVKPDNTKKYTKEIFTFSIDIGATDEVNGTAGNSSMIHFGGKGESELFKGTMVGGMKNADTRLQYKGQIQTLSARYILNGTDKNGNACRVYVENNGIDNNGMVTEPTIITDCPDYAWIETAPLHGTVGWEPGLTIHMWTTEDAYNAGFAK